MKTLRTAAALALAFAATSAHAGYGFVNGITSNGITSNGSILLPTESCACSWSSNDTTVAGETVVGSTVLIGVELPK